MKQNTPQVIPQAKAFAIIRAYGARPSEFVVDWGRRPEYELDAVMAWLGV